MPTVTVEEKVRAMVADQLGMASYFLKIEGIEGESTVRGHEREIEVMSYAWGVENAAVTTRPGIANPSFQNLQVIASASKAGPTLMLQCATGQMIRRAILTGVRTGSEKPQDAFMKVTLGEVVIVQYHTAASAGDGARTDTIGLKFEKIEVEYREMRPDGTLGGTVQAGFDIKKNTKV